MGLNNIHTLPHVSLPLQNTDLIFSQEGTSKAITQWKLYIAGSSSTVEDEDLIVAAKPSGMGKQYTAEELKDFINNESSDIVGMLFVPVLRSSVLYYATATELAEFIAFTPASVSNLLAWYDVTDGSYTTNSGGKVTAINDKKASGLNLTNTGGAARPDYFATGGANNKAYIKVTSELEIFSPTSIPGGWGNDLTFYIVFKHVSGTDVVLADFSGTQTHGFKMTSGGRPRFTGSAGGNTDGKKDGNTGNWNFMKFNYQTTPSSRYGMNNEIFDHYNYDYTNGGLSANGIARIGLGWRAVQSIETHFHEMLICQGLPSDADDLNIRRYLKSKYAIVQNQSILFFGDSITHGAAATDNDATSFAALACIAKSKVRCYFDYPGGAISTPGSYAETPVESGAKFIDKVEHFINLVNKGYDTSQITDCVITYGTNDAASSSTVAGWKALYKSTIQRLINEGGISADKIILGTAPYHSTRVSTVGVLNTAIEEICDELNLQFADFWSATQAGGGDSLLTDGTHPDNTGHDIMADTLIPLLS